MKKKSPKRRTVRPGGLVTNESAEAPELVTNKFVTLAVNAETSLIRNDEMEGRKYLVVPMVMMTEGVHAGSNGPLLYPADELSKTPEVWNQKPVIVYHKSTKSGKGVGACHPDVLTKHKIGVIMNTEWDADKKRLVAEAWLDPERVKEVDTRVHNAIKKKKVMELSTGLFTDNEVSEGTHDGEAYEAIARNYRPDHLAVLPDQIGACSVAKGAGFIRNELRANYPEMDEEDVELLRGQIHNALHNLKSPAIRILLTNEASHEELRSMLHEALQKRYRPADADRDWIPGLWIEAVYASHIIYSKGGKLFRINYSKSSDTSVKLVGEPSEVVRVTEYKTKDSESTTNADEEASSKPNNKKKAESTMNKEEMVAALIANHGYSEESREKLMGLDDKTVEVMLNTAKKAVENKTTATTTAPAPTPADKKTENAAPALDDEDKAALAYGKRTLAENKAKLVQTITANKANVFTAAQLNGMSIDQLESIAALARNSAPAEQPSGTDFSGLGHIAPIHNANLGEGDALVMPGMTFDA